MMFYRDKDKFPKWILTVGLFILGTIVLMSSFFFISKKDELKNTDIRISKITANNNILVFYEDSCSDCQKVYPLLYLNKLINKRVILINLNGKRNKQYIREYGLTSVPTIIHGNQEYSGTKIEEILKIIN